MRGKGDDRIVARYNDRITPAYAGKSLQSRGAWFVK